MVDAAQNFDIAKSVSHRFDFEGANKVRSRATRDRIFFAMLVFFSCFLLMFGRLVALGLEQQAVGKNTVAQGELASTRPDLVDRNGEILATDIKTASVFAEPNKIVDVEETIEGVLSVFPDLDADTLRARLSNKKSNFAWIKREITPRQQQAIHEKGIPGLDFLSENKRFYPAGSTASHILGLVNVDNAGIAGMEKFVDDTVLSEDDEQRAESQSTLGNGPIQLSIDLRVQHALRDELQKSMTKFKAMAAAGVVLDAKNGEVLGMASLPDFDPNNPVDVNKPDHLNRMTAGVYEMGSVFKTVTVAMALDSGSVHLNDSFDARKPIRVSGSTISDFHAKKKILSVPEVFVYSSNVGSAKMALKVGRENHQEFLRKAHLLERVQTELPESRLPVYPKGKRWTDLSTMTISFGHGVQVSPLQFTATAAALVNGGLYVKPTFLKRKHKLQDSERERIISDKTSAEVRYLMRLNAVKGSGKRSRVDGYLVGGKTGTAEKVIDGKYASNRLRNSYLAAFPIDDPQYVVLVMLDEPKGLKETYGYATAGVNTAPLAGAVIRRIGSILGVKPRFDEKTVSTVEASF
ncbi:penicillin-binding protein 2 [uncultured Cohaesibacter sp.]|uniref:peptidoglycan D,D-transpeptidase FtsI family protein n=1 Tax=uncultured Cohaesibacter sp. TaxID=1002546 RepID=UPI00292D4480|nr:penicillin-binding protein 2 [uncultured Cohaesibacter sp.]